MFLSSRRSMGIFWNRNVSRDKAGDLGITKSRGSHWAVLDKIRLIIWKCQTEQRNCWGTGGEGNGINLIFVHTVFDLLMGHENYTWSGVSWKCRSEVKSGNRVENGFKYKSSKQQQRNLDPLLYFFLELFWG